MAAPAGALSRLSLPVIEANGEGPGALTLSLYRAGARVVNVATPDSVIEVLPRLEPDAVIADISLAPRAVMELPADARHAGFDTLFIAVLEVDDFGHPGVTLDAFAAVLRRPINHDVLVISVLSVTECGPRSAGSSERITRFLVGTSPARSCDACIAQHIHMDRIAVRRVTTRLTFLPQFSRRKTRCSTCRQLRATTRARLTGEGD